MSKFIKEIPCLSHPITVLFLDDNQGFLDSLEMELGKQGQMLTFTDPNKAKAALESTEEDIVKKISKVFADADTDSLNEKLIDFDINNIRSFIYDAERFNYVAVMVVDYQMPDLTGLDFCRSIKERHVYKVMLTAEAGKDTAIAAFNEGVIDKFLLKKSDALCEQLVDVIDELKAKYFQDLSKPLLNSFGAGSYEALKSSAFIKIFNDVLQESNAVEYYLIDTSCSYLFLDASGSPTWLIIRSSQDFDDHLDILSGLASAPELTASLKRKEKLLFLLSEEEYQQPVEEWGNYLYDAKKLDDLNWYTVVKGPTKNSIHWDDVKSYKERK